MSFHTVGDFLGTWRVFSLPGRMHCFVDEEGRAGIGRLVGEPIADEHGEGVDVGPGGIAVSIATVAPTASPVGSLVNDGFAVGKAKVVKKGGAFRIIERLLGPRLSGVDRGL